MRKIDLKNIIKESITDYLSALNETTEEVTPMQQYLMDYESEISNSPEQYFDDIKKLNSINDVIGYYGGRRQWTADKDLKQELSNLIKTLKSKFSVNEDSSVPADSTGMALDMMKNGLPTQTGTSSLREKSPDIVLENNISKDGKIYLVKKAMNESTDSDMVEERTLAELIGEEYCGVYSSKEKAMAHSKKALKERDLMMKENVKKGQAKIGGLEKQVADLKVQMQKLIDSPEMRGELTNYTSKLEKAEQVLEKLKAAIEKSSPKKEKKETKEDIKEAKSRESQEDTKEESVSQEKDGTWTLKYSAINHDTKKRENLTKKGFKSEQAAKNFMNMFN